MGAPGRERGGSREGGKREGARQKGTPPGRGALRAHTRDIGLGHQCWWPAMASVPWSLPLSSATPALPATESGCRWCMGASGPFFLPVRSLLPCDEGRGKAEADLGSQRNQKDGAGKERVSVRWGNGRNEKSGSLSFLFFLPRCGPAAWVGKVSPGRGSRVSLAFHQNLCSQRSFQHLTSRLDPPKLGQRLTLGDLREPGASSWAHAGGFGAYS